MLRRDAFSDRAVTPSASPAVLAPPRRDMAARSAHAPRFRTDLISRPRLLRKLPRALDVPLVLAVAPAGYGKTVLLSEWALRDPRPFAWLTLDGRANEADELEAMIEAAVAPLDHAAPFVLVLDDAEHVVSPAALRVLTEISHRLPPGSVLALASRREPALSVGRLRAHRLVVELGAADLRMTQMEASMLMHAAGVRLSREGIEHLMDRTEGWAAGLSIAALWMRDHPEDGELAPGSRLVRDYVRDAILSDLSPLQARFLRDTSVLETLSGRACDAILDREDSGLRLAELARANVPMFAVGGHEDEFRCPPFLTDALRAEVDRLAPRRRVDLHRRAARFYEQQRDLVPAIDHAFAADDVLYAAALTWDALPDHLADGSIEELHARAEELSRDEIAGSRHLASSMAVFSFVAGDAEGVDHWSACASRTPWAPGDVAAATAAVRASTGRGGFDATAAAARAAHFALGDGSPWTSLCLLLEGVSAHLGGRRDAAREALEEGVRAGALIAPWAQVLCLAQLALLAAEHEDWEEAAARGYRARSLVQSTGLTEYPMSALVYVVSALAAANRGQIDVAERDAAQAEHLLGALELSAPWYLAEVLVWLARARMRLSDAGAAQDLLAQARRAARGIGDGPVLAEWVDEATRRAQAFSASQAAPLTPAELRILRYLPSHLSFREIGEQLYVSTNTVKTHALGVYRKLDVTSRSSAVARARALDLIDE
jgi:LuxR family maltose regulon positive regulatory protein